MPIKWHLPGKIGDSWPWLMTYQIQQWTEMHKMKQSNISLTGNKKVHTNGVNLTLPIPEVHQEQIENVFEYECGQSTCLGNIGLFPEMVPGSFF